MRKVQAVTLVVAVLAGVGGGTYALARAFGAGSAPVPVHTGPTPTPSVTAVIGLCTGESASLTGSQDSGAGTIHTVWQVTNTAASPCRSFGYPAVAIHTAGGWRPIAAHEGGFPDIERQPASVVAPSRGSLYFVTYWNDVTSIQGPCVEFDRVRVTLPDDRTPVEAATSGCMNPTSLDEGPLTKSPPR